MEQIFEFIGSHMMLSISFMVVLMFIIIYELREKQMGSKKVSPAQAVALMNHHNGVVVDCRDDKAFLEGHILNARQASIKNIEQIIKKVKNYQTTPIILVFGMGAQTKAIDEALDAAGAKQVFHLKGGVPAWKDAELPLVKG